MNTEIKQYKLGIVAPRSFTDITMLEDQLLDKIFHIRHIVGNGVEAGGKTVEKFADSHKIPKTVYPITAGDGGVFKSNWAIVTYSDFIYIFDDGESKNVSAVADECEKQGKKYKIIPYLPEPSLAKYEKALAKIGRLVVDGKLAVYPEGQEIIKVLNKFKNDETKD